MILLPLPTISGKEIRDACVPEIKKPARRRRIAADEPNILLEEAAFRAALISGGARALTPRHFVSDVKTDMIWLYANRLLERWGATYRAEIMSQTDGECTFCHVAKARTIDHSFPKSLHPRLSVEPANMVPACRDCNLNRGVGSGKCSVSPYADIWMETTPWLRARIPDLRRPGQLEFYVASGIGLTADQEAAVGELFTDADLGPRYALLASKEFARAVKRIQRRARGDIARLAAEIFDEEAEDALIESGLNRWETAAYSAWAASATAIPWSTL